MRGYIVRTDRDGAGEISWTCGASSNANGRRIHICKHQVLALHNHAGQQVPPLRLLHGMYSSFSVDRQPNNVVG